MCFAQIFVHGRTENCAWFLAWIAGHSKFEFLILPLFKKFVKKTGYQFHLGRWEAYLVVGDTQSEAIYQ